MRRTSETTTVRVESTQMKSGSSALKMEEMRRRWDEGIANHEKLKQIFPFLKEEEESFL